MALCAPLIKSMAGEFYSDLIRWEHGFNFQYCSLSN